MSDVNMCCGGIGLHKFGCPTGTSLWREQRIAELEARADRVKSARIAELKAALAERDRMLRLAYRDVSMAHDPFSTEVEIAAGTGSYLTDLRARAKRVSNAT